MRRPWPNLLEVFQNCVAYYRNKRIFLSISPFQAFDIYALCPPINVVEGKLGRLSDSPSVNGKQKNDGAIAESGRTPR